MACRFSSMRLIWRNENCPLLRACTEDGIAGPLQSTGSGPQAERRYSVLPWQGYVCLKVQMLDGALSPKCVCMVQRED